ncbi:hypothetical protein KIN20_021963 [Parelaphostrongylus tenuis]|uniref:Uncharacterized protein n=1 Tax=Parelaphostrongylus tenuis TaxID=148309 RepID=A0AAD5QUV7_PARTN|nr:hypothetical protein KIN20_021963 [Parelaphostrongylus tenuis]
MLSNNGDKGSESNGVAPSSDKTMPSNDQIVISTRAWAENVKYDPDKIFDKVW